MGLRIFFQITEYDGLIETALAKADRELQVALGSFDLISRDATECIYNAEIALGRAIEDNRENLRICQFFGPKTSVMFGEN